jgi:polar amino acid transport system substrate-binding protein
MACVRHYRLSAAALVLLVFAANARSADFIYATSSATAPPMTIYKGGVLEAGIQKDIGNALAGLLDSRVTFVDVPRRRLPDSINQGTVDIVCDLHPTWVQGKDWTWSGDLIDHEAIVVSLADKPMVSRIGELGGAHVGTIAGYLYPEFDAALGERFLRDDAPTDASNLHKLLARRFEFALTTRLSLDYLASRPGNSGKFNPATLRFSLFTTRCVLSPKSKISKKDFVAATATLKKSGAMEAILSKYR